MADLRSHCHRPDDHDHRRCSAADAWPDSVASEIKVRPAGSSHRRQCTVGATCRHLDSFRIDQSLGPRWFPCGCCCATHRTRAGRQHRNRQFRTRPKPSAPLADSSDVWPNAFIRMDRHRRNHRRHHQHALRYLGSGRRGSARFQCSRHLRDLAPAHLVQWQVKWHECR
ncbi:unannotated protein [freshwater metagenome]|uniref:Unannotated protein n=1 Tax=freshwater metagenome TaxID=449393 RepID=A0A6J7P2Y1_9ZZZZ